MSDTITLTHSVEELNLILSALSDRPFKEVAGLLFKIKNSAEYQMRAAEPPPGAEPV